MPLPASRRTFCAHPYRSASDLTDPGEARHWITRGVNMVVVVTEASAGATLSRKDQVDEYMAIIPPGVRADLAAGTDGGRTPGDALAILPPGASRIVLP